MKQNVIARFSVKSDKLETFFEFAKVLIEKEQSVMEHKQSVHLAEFLQKIENLLQKPPIVELHTIN